MIDFKVSEVAVEQQPYSEKFPYRKTDYKDSLRYLIGDGIESFSKTDLPRVDGVNNHALVSAIHNAFAYHYPLELSPDSVWLTLTMGLAKHIELNAEKLRHHFVEHEGKVKITIQRDGFIRGNADNDWAGTFSEFSSKIKEHIGDKTHRAIIADYSTTTPIDRAASEVVLMDAMKQYFDYGVSTLCGIPNITLTGKTSDWESIQEKVYSWAEWDLSWWVAPVLRILDEFVSASKGSVNRQWWESIYKYHGAQGSGDSSRITGWVNWLFPYIGDKKNTRLGVLGKDKYDGLNPENYPKSISSVPFVWNYYGQELNYKFLAGLTTAVQDPKSLIIKPISGWAVQDTSKSGRASGF